MHPGLQLIHLLFAEASSDMDSVQVRLQEVIVTEGRQEENTNYPKIRLKTP